MPSENYRICPNCQAVVDGLKVARCWRCGASLREDGATPHTVSMGRRVLVTLGGCALVLLFALGGCASCFAIASAGTGVLPSGLSLALGGVAFIACMVCGLWLANHLSRAYTE